MNPNSKSESQRESSGASAPGAVRPLRERLREETSRAIVAAAEKVFAAQGIHAARMEEIAASAGVSVGTVYNHFEDRDALLTALLADRRAELCARLDLALDQGAREPFPLQLERFITALFLHFESHRPFLSIVIEGEHARSPTLPPPCAKPSEAMNEIYQRAEKLMHRGVQKKVLRGEGALLWPALFMGCVKGALVQEIYRPSAASLVARAPELVRFFLEGAKA